MLMVNEDALRDRAVMLRRWGRRSELHFFGSKRNERNFWEDLDGIEYDNQFIFDELAWNFEPSEMGAGFGLEQMKKIDSNFARRRKTFDRYTEHVGRHADRFVLPANSKGLETAWLGYPLIIKPGAGFGRPICRGSSTGAARDPDDLDRQRGPTTDVAWSQGGRHGGRSSERR